MKKKIHTKCFNHLRYLATFPSVLAKHKSVEILNPKELGYFSFFHLEVVKDYKPMLGLHQVQGIQACITFFFVIQLENAS